MANIGGTSVENAEFVGLSGRSHAYGSGGGGGGPGAPLRPKTGRSPRTGAQRSTEQKL